MTFTKRAQRGGRRLSLPWVLSLLGVALGAALVPTASAVVGGTASDPTLSVARITVTSAAGGAQLCSGVVVAPQWVATAGHCVVDPATVTVAKPQSMIVTLGETAYGQGGEPHLARAVMTPALFDPANPTQLADLAMIKLDVPTAGTPMAITQAPPNVGDMVQYYGWGQTLAQADAPPAQNLMTSTGPVSTATQCTTAGGRYFCEQNADAGQGVCFGDAGGPVVLNGMLVGVISGVEPTAFDPNKYGCPNRTRMVSTAFSRDFLLTTIAAG